MLKLITFISLVFLLFNAQATTLTAEQASKVLNLPNTLAKQGKFEQKKYFKVLSVPFVSAGHYQQDAEQFIWATQTPVPTTLTFDGQNLWQIDANGQRTQLPLSESFIRVINALVTGDILTLSSYFKLSATEQSQCVLLAPIDKQMSMIADTILLCHANNMLSIRLNEPNDNYTEINVFPHAENSSPKE
ncbi:LolA family protein [Thalassotalea marina]|uniref:Outer membrane lipoprotein carrier protein LolA n=1 Tax=Thalassotalea marina TaxID=1673741 RepID=A0A919ELY7_9GAMM|nr:outer membrane lipoprotein carrier protein LolA [Thalassotalea marina]GHF97126.1 hypothetical protein GCM10017161_26560 [Thalassotalea marina]